MYNIKTLNKIAHVGLDRLKAKDFNVSDEIENPHGIILRSYSMHEMQLPESLLAVARAGAGTNNIPIDKCSENGVVVFNTPGANANAVKELVLAGLFISSRRVVSGIEWVKSLKGQPDIEKLVEKGKSQFVGPEIEGKKLGVIGLGAIGVMVANAAKSLGMEVVGYDPYLSIDAAWQLSRSVKRAENIETVVSECDYITIHIPMNSKTKGFYNKELFASTKKGARLLNFARGELVDNKALKEALENGTISAYVTDFPSQEVLEMEHVIVTPHIGASTPESEDNCAEMAAIALKAYLKYGTIKNSVNFPNCEVTYVGKARISICHKNVPNMVSSIASVFAKDEINIDNLTNSSKGVWAYTLVDADDLHGKGEDLIQSLKQIDGIVAARIVREEE